MVRVAVIGAGAVGLSSAINIQRMLPQVKVTVIADKFGNDTTSAGAGGFFRPYLPDFLKGGVDPEVVKRWIRDSWEFYSGLAKSPAAEESGSYFVYGDLAYYNDVDEGYSLMKELAPDFHKLPQSRLHEMGLGRYSHGYGCTTVMTQAWKLQSWLMKTFKEGGGTVINRKVNSFTELSSEYDVVVNCCGLRSAEVAGDNTSFPIKGHLVWLRAPWIKKAFFSEESIYLFPHEDKLIVGGIRERGNSDLTPDPAKRQLILSRAEELFPQLKGAQVVGEWCGLRPGRPTVRLEKELVDCGRARKLPVVHNYGHAGHGITLAWGCGRHTAQHVKDIVNTMSSRL